MILLALNFVVPVVVCKDRANSNLSLRKTGTVFSEFYGRISAGQPCNRTVDNNGTIIKIGLIVVETIYLFMSRVNGMSRMVRLTRLIARSGVCVNFR